MKTIQATIIYCFIILLTGWFAHESQAQEVVVIDAFPGVSIPNILGLEAPDDTPNVYLLSQPGQVYRLDTSVEGAEPELWLNISDRLIAGGERGLLGLAFPPDFEESGVFYVNYTRPSPLRTTISRFFTDDEGMAEAGSEQILLEFTQPFNNHNGGKIAFGPDGYLYIASGDGGSGGDPEGHGQDTQTLLGAMLRIDVDTIDATYNIPLDNPFAGVATGADEIYAWGLRNPWRFSFDRETGTLWTGDVGQNAWEAIHIIENGLNYGWAIIEGSNCYPPGTTCDTEGLEMPVYEYDHSEGDRSITGGYVYRGQNNPELVGKYIYGDYISGRMWALDFDEDTEEVISNVELTNNTFNISSFGEDAQGELYILAYNTGRIFTIVTQPVQTSILQPEAGQTVPVDFTLVWEAIAGADQYQYQVALDSDFEELIFDDTADTNSVDLSYEADEEPAYARVRSSNEAGESEWSVVVPFIIGGPVSTEPLPETPDALTLYPAYPNPFNPTSNIRFSLPEAGEVNMSVYNLNGQQVARLAAGTYTAGTHTIQFDAARLASGVYTVVLEAQGTRLVQQVTLLK